MKAFTVSSFAFISAISLLSELTLAQKVAECTNSEIDELINNSNVRNCASNYQQLMPNKGCKSLMDQSCYCHSPVSHQDYESMISPLTSFPPPFNQEFMAAMTACLFKEEPDVQEELLRCGKVQSGRKRQMKERRTN